MILQRFRNFSIIAIFAATCATPLVAMVLRLDRSPHLRENRERASFPDLARDKETLKKLPHDFYVYFNDNFGYRDDLIRLNFLIRRSFLKEREFNDVLFGKEGWLYYLGEREMDDSRGITHYDEKTLAAWTASLERKRRWLASRGIRYLLVIAPNKASIYSENLPSYFMNLHDTTGLDEFVQYVRSHSEVELIDLRATLKAAKTMERCYEKTDTHWNDYGAFVAYREIMKTLSRWYPLQQAQTLDDYVIERKLVNGGDLAMMAGGAEFLKEEEILLVPKRARKAFEIEVNKKNRLIVMGQDSPNLPRALVFRDSFFDALIPFVSEHFQYAGYHRRHWDETVPIASLVKTASPDVVIEEFLERVIKTNIGDFDPKD